MAVINQILTRWTTVNGGGKVTVMYFDDSQTIANQRLWLGQLYSAIAPALAVTTSLTIDTTGSEIDSDTGTLTGQWSESTGRVATGSGIGNTVADATQMLLRWRTGTIQRGRFVQGRSFIPGATVGNEQSGGVNSSTITTVNAAMATFLGHLPGLVIWSRPSGVTPGAVATVFSGQVWPEFAVLRRRRDV